MEIEQLKLYVDEYLNSLDNNNEHEWYSTNRNNALSIVDDLVQHIEGREAICDAISMLEHNGYVVHKK